MVVPSVAVIVDLVDSRLIDDRAAAQARILAGFERVDAAVDHVQPLRATTADEFQAVYASIPDALEATLLARLSLPAGLDCRFGIAEGHVVTVGEGTTGDIQDGSGWWLARAAIDEAHRRENSRTPSLRSWFRNDVTGAPIEPVINAYLLSRDHIVGAMTERTRRLTLGLLLGQLQGDLAAAEGITQSAVSQALRRSGGATLAAAIDELRKVLP
jgi:hypothetical protein